MRICLDPGHGGTAKGATANGYVEKDLNLALGLKVQTLLSPYCIVDMTRTTDKDMSLLERATYAKLMQADLLLSLHFNAFDGVARGTEAIYPIHVDARFAELAAHLADNAARAIGVPYRRIFSLESRKHPGQNWYGLINHAVPLPCIILESLFIDNDKDIKVLRGINTLDKIAAAIVRTLVGHYKLTKSGEYSYVGTTNIIKVNPLNLYVELVNDTGVNLAKHKPNCINGNFYWWKLGKHYPLGWLISRGKALNYYNENALKPNCAFIVFKDGTVICRTMTRTEIKAMAADIWFCVQGFNLFRGIDYPNLRTSMAAEGFKYDEVGRPCWRPAIGYNPVDKMVYITGRPSSDAERATMTMLNLGCKVGIGIDAGKSATYVHDGKVEIASKEILDNIILW